MQNKFTTLALGILLCAGCRDNPFDRTKDASKGGPTGTISGNTSFVVYNNELKSGGGAFLYPGAEGQTLSFNDTSNSISRRSIRYSWTGQAVSNTKCSAQNPTHNFAGFNLMDQPTQGQYDASAVGRDLRAAGYTKVTFYARGSLSTNTYLKVEVAAPFTSNACTGVTSPCIVLFDPTRGDPRTGPQDATCTTGILNSSWGSYMVPVGNGDLQSIKDFFKATFVFVDLFPGSPTAGQGGTAYFDVIQYQP